MSGAGILWLEPAAPSQEQDFFEYGSSSPLYKISIRVERNRNLNGWSTCLVGTLKFPMGKIGSIETKSEWQNNSPSYLTYAEQGPTPVKWRRVADGLERQTNNQRPTIVLSELASTKLNLSLFCGAEALFSFVEAAPRISDYGGFLVSVGTKVFAGLISKTAQNRFEMRFVPAPPEQLESESKDALFSKLNWVEGRTTEVEYDEKKRAITRISARAPVFGQLTLKLLS